MATTILKNLKEAKNRKPSQHLHNAINYIMNPEKTENGLWIGSNCGITSQEIYDAMMSTKNEFNKTFLSVSNVLPVIFTFDSSKH